MSFGWVYTIYVYVCVRLHVRYLGPGPVQIQVKWRARVLLSVVWTSPAGVARRKRRGGLLCCGTVRYQWPLFFYGRYSLKGGVAVVFKKGHDGDRR
jgi:hypothetical protein